MDSMVIGIVRSSHGVDGFVKVESTSGEVEHFAGLSEITLRIPVAGGSFASERIEKKYEIEAAEGSAALLLLKFRGIDTPEEAKKLAGAQLVVPRDMACPLDEDEWYVSDICQCVLMYEGKPVGKITGVVEGGAGDLLEVTLTEGDELGKSQPKTCLVPLRNEFIGTVDLVSKTVELMHRWILE